MNAATFLFSIRGRSVSLCRLPGCTFIVEGEDRATGGEVGGSEVVGGLYHHHHRLANPAGLLRRTPVSTQTPCSVERTVHGKVGRNHRQILRNPRVSRRRRLLTGVPACVSYVRNTYVPSTTEEIRSNRPKQQAPRTLAGIFFIR